MTSAPWAIVARLVRPQGRHGEILADVLTDFPDRFAQRRCLYLVDAETDPTPAREVTLEQHWLHKGRIVLKFSGVNSINDAETLRNFLVAIPASERVPLTDDAVYISDLIGCEVVDLASSSTPVGRIADVDREAGLLIVRPVHGEELLIPFAKDYLVAINTATKRIEMRLPGGLLDINAPVTEEERRSLEKAGDGVGS
jgi:16S rRNA processing protein RimM